MCIEVLCDGDIVDRCGELAKALGCELEDLIGDRHYGSDPREPCECLCPIDLRATAAKYGKVINRIDGYPHWEIATPPAN
jgi:hypothetical protein